MTTPNSEKPSMTLEYYENFCRDYPEMAAKELLSLNQELEGLKNPVTEPKSPEAFISHCCFITGVKRSQLFSHFRFKRHNEIRRAISYCLRVKFNMSYPEIAGYLNRDHTTIMAWVRLVQGEIDQNEGPLLEWYNTLIEGTSL